MGENLEFPWSSEGLELLNTIKKYIDKSGGRFVLANDLVNENKFYFTKEQRKEFQFLAYMSQNRLKRNNYKRVKKPWNEKDERYVIDHFGKMSARRIAKHLARDSRSITKRALFLLGEKEYKKRILGNNNYIKTIIKKYGK